VKDNTGYDLAGLLVGSEGTLGIVTAARLRLVPSQPDRIVVLAGVPTVEEAMALVAQLRANVDGLDAIEAIVGDGLDLGCRELRLPRPFAEPAGVALLTEWAGHGEPPDAFVKALAPYPSAAATDAAGRAAAVALPRGVRPRDRTRRRVPQARCDVAGGRPWPPSWPPCRTSSRRRPRALGSTCSGHVG
jgi:FAD/FMN-containing dehydrogenase